LSFLALGFVLDEDSRTASGFIGGLFAVLILVLMGLTVALVIAWPIDRWKDRAARRRVVQEQAPKVVGVAAPARGMPAFSMPALVPMSYSHGQVMVPQDVSAFEETAHVHLPDKMPSYTERYRPITLGDLLTMTPTEFEQLCVRALLNLGYDQVKRTGGSGDLAADIVGKDPQGRSVIVQCKRYAPGSAIGSPVVQTFIGMKVVHHKADRGIIMTTAEFSKPAIELAKAHDIVLIDGDDIVKILNLVGAR
jgi:HJR/Mrr/RecB family endonuclease